LTQREISRIHTELSIDVQTHSTYKEISHFRFNESMNAPPDSNIVSECNGLLLNMKNMSPVMIPVSRVFRLKDKSAPKIDMSSVRVFVRPTEEYFVFMYYFNNCWNISTVQDPQAEEIVGGIQVKNIFWDVWKNLGYSLPEFKNISFTFTLQSNKVRSSIYCDKEDICLFAAKITDSQSSARDLDFVEVAQKMEWHSFVECHNTDTKLFLIEDPRLFGLSEFLRSFGNIAGLLLVDKDYMRIYVESPLNEMLQEINNTEDKQTHELLLIRAIAEYPFKNSTLVNYPWNNTLETYKHVFNEFFSFCAFLDEKYYPLQHLPPAQFNEEAEKIGDLAAFLYFMKKASYPSSKQYFEQDSTFFAWLI
jgi:hypothetical protein